jgi:hypothetical protein
MAAAEVNRVHEYSRDEHMQQLTAGCRPARPHQHDDRAQAQQSEGIAQREKRERRRVLKADLGGEKTRAPDDDEIPGEQRVLPARNTWGQSNFSAPSMWW